MQQSPPPRSPFALDLDGDEDDRAAKCWVLAQRIAAELNPPWPERVAEMSEAEIRQIANAANIYGMLFAADTLNVTLTENGFLIHFPPLAGTSGDDPTRRYVSFEATAPWLTRRMTGAELSRCANRLRRIAGILDRTDPADTI